MSFENLGGRYELIRFIGSGGMGSVYEGIDTVTRARVAVKLLHNSSSGASFTNGVPASFSRVKREARAMRTIRSPHIVSFLDVAAHPDTGAPYLVMELLEGEDLQRTLHRLGALPARSALKIAAQACSGLQAAHNAGVIHRDIKPSNLFLERRGDGELVVKILDFGIAKINHATALLDQATTLTDSSMMLGTPHYTSPDQLRSAKRCDHRADVWSLGAVLYCALTGFPPHAEVVSFVKLVAAICGRRPRPVRALMPRVSPEAVQIVERAMEIDRSQRFQSALAMLVALRELLPDGVALRDDMDAPPCPSSTIRPLVSSTQLMG